MGERRKACRQPEPAGNRLVGGARATAAAAAITTAAISTSLAEAPISVSHRAAAKVVRAEPLLDRRSLLIEEHPGHDHRTDRRDDEVEISRAGRTAGVARTRQTAPTSGPAANASATNENRASEEHDGHDLEPAITAREHDDRAGGERCNDGDGTARPR